MEQLRLFVALSLCALLVLTPAGGAPQESDPDDIDAFMKKVLEQRNTNWQVLQTYIFAEEEVLDLTGINIPALESFKKEYLWFYRDDRLIRSLVRANGVKVSAREQERSEEKWGRKKKGKGEEDLTRESFFEFEFEPGNYFFAGREMFEDREVFVVIEYYPDKFFGEDDDESDTNDKLGRKRDEDDEEEEFEEAFKKTTLVTMWIIPEIHQLAKITFENVGLEFLPYRWLVRIDDIRASLIMDTPAEGLWLPREIYASGSISTALNTLSVGYARKFSDYQEADVKVRLQFEKPPAGKPPAKKPTKPPGTPF